jgi:hypothetical protein
MKKEEKDDDGTQKKPKKTKANNTCTRLWSKSKKEDESKMMSKRCKEM